MDPNIAQNAYSNQSQLKQDDIKEQQRFAEEMQKFKAVIDAVDITTTAVIDSTTKAEKSSSKMTTNVTKEIKTNSDNVVSTLKANSTTTKACLDKLIQVTLESKDQELLNVVSNFTSLLQGLTDAISNIEQGPLNELPKVNKELGLVLQAINKELTEKEEPDYTDAFVKLEEAVKKIDIKPVVKVAKDTIDLSPLEDLLAQVRDAVVASGIEIPENDLSPVIVSLQAVQDTIANLKFPSPNFILPYKTSDGTATQGSARVLSSQIVGTDTGIVANAVIHGKTTAGGGSYVDVKVNPSGALTTDATISGNVFTESAIYYKRLDDTTTLNMIYIGEATPGTATSAATWRIKRLDLTAGLIIQWADSGDFTQVWNNRASLTYN